MKISRLRRLGGMRAGQGLVRERVTTPGPLAQPWTPWLRNSPGRDIDSTQFSGLTPNMHVRTMISVVLAGALLAASVLSPASARGGRARHSGNMRSAVVNDEAHRQRNEAYLKSVSHENERVIGKLKSICRGC